MHSFGYLKKYYKYKTKYINLKNQLGGNPIYALCLYILNENQDILVDETLEVDRYDKTFIECFKNLFIPNYNITKQDALSNRIYFLEDAWLLSDPRIILERFNELTTTRTSIFFFKKNIINMAITIRCWFNRCFDNLYTYINSLPVMLKKSTESKHQKLLDQIHRDFLDCKKEFAEIILEAYRECSYDAVIMMYKYYFKFYYEHIAPHYQSLGFNINDCYSTIISHLEDSSIFMYFSFNIPHASKYINFIPTGIIVSTISNKPIHRDSIINSISISCHDFIAHNAYNRNKKNVSNREIFYRIISQLYVKYSCNKKLYEQLALVIHNAGHEKALELFGIKEVISYLTSQYNLYLDMYIEFLEIWGDRDDYIEDRKQYFNNVEDFKKIIYIYIEILHLICLSPEESKLLEALTALCSSPIPPL